MTNPELTKELKDKLKEGVKPSDLKKLKRSKSADDIPSTDEKLPTQTDLTILLQDQLKEKQKEIEILREKLETKNRELAQTQTELDNSLLARQKSNKQFTLIYDKLQQVKQELNENVNQASDELLNQDEEISKLREQKQQTKLRIQELERDLNLSQRLAQMRKVPLPSDERNWDYLKYALYSLCAVGFTL
jgi:chromosome segregation ATPase